MSVDEMMLQVTLDLLFCLGACCFVLATGGIHTSYRKYRKQLILKDISIQKDTILRLKNPYTGVALTTQSQLEARTIPNARLQIVFGVNNAFTTQDVRIANTFKFAARTKLRDAVKISKKVGVGGVLFMEDTDAQWDGIVSSIKRFVQEELDGVNEIINLAELVQFITLKISIMYLFNPGGTVLSDREAIKYVAKTINILWIRSKNADVTNADGNNWIDEHRLHDHLRTITGLDSTEDTTNPMNFILPAYETMWRAVLRGLLEVYFRNAPDSLAWQQILCEFINNSERGVFRKEDSTTILCALDIVKEILRMYPPTRRVSRRFPDDAAGLTRSADIEKCHRNALLVPIADAEVFRPDRWLEVKKAFKLTKSTESEESKVKKSTAEYKLSDYEEDLGYMPFALSCPAGGKATQGFEFKMIGFLVVTLCRGFDRLNKKRVDLGDTTVSEDSITDEEIDDSETVSTSEGNHGTDNDLAIKEAVAIEEGFEVQETTSDENKIDSKSNDTAQLQRWKLQAESPRDELPPLGTALKSERSDYMSPDYRRVV